MPVRARRQPAAPSLETATIPAPTGGLNTISPGAAMPPTDCILSYNLVAAEYGLRVRLGQREWCTGLTGASDNWVRTTLPFNGSAANGAKDKVFATTSSGIWDVTDSSTSPSLVLSFATTTGDAGYGVAHGMVTSAGHFLAYCDEVNGLHVYTESTNTWAAVAMGAGASQIAGVDPVNLVFCTVFKGKLWFVERDTASLWYLSTGAIYGTATKFALGTQLRAGGPIVGLWNWTIDGGAGIDDSLVAVSGGGDVAIYQGTDPSSASTFGIKGVWYLGPPPAGREIATNFGGDILLMSRTGIVPLSKLVQGADIGSQQHSTYKIGPLFNSLMLTRATYRGWSMRIHPEDNALIVTVPTGEGMATEQLVMSLATFGWGRYRDLPIYSSEVYGGKLYFGTADGRVCINDGYVDGVTLADPNSYSAINWAVLTSFQNLGNARQKQVQIIRPLILSESADAPFDAQARYKYDFTDNAPVSVGTSGTNTWDNGLWDTATFAGDYTATQETRGGSGMGTDIAVAINGSASSRTVLVSVDVAFTQGGLL